MDISSIDTQPFRSEFTAYTSLEVLRTYLHRHLTVDGAYIHGITVMAWIISVCKVASFEDDFGLFSLTITTPRAC